MVKALRQRKWFSAGRRETLSAHKLSGVPATVSENIANSAFRSILAWLIGIAAIILRSSERLLS